MGRIRGEGEVARRCGLAGRRRWASRAVHQLGPARRCQNGAFSSPPDPGDTPPTRRRKYHPAWDLKSRPSLAKAHRLWQYSPHPPSGGVAVGKSRAAGRASGCRCGGDRRSGPGRRPASAPRLRTWLPAGLGEPLPGIRPSTCQRSGGRGCSAPAWSLPPREPAGARPPGARRGRRPAAAAAGRAFPSGAAAAATGRPRRPPRSDRRRASAGIADRPAGRGGGDGLWKPAASARAALA